MSHLTIEFVYDCAMEPGNWQRALDAVVRDAEAQAASLMVRDVRERPWVLNHVSSVYAQMLAEGSGQVYLENYAHYEERQFAAIAGLPVGELRLDTDLGIAREELDARPDYVFLTKNAGATRRIVARLNNNPGWFDALAVGFPNKVFRPSEQAYRALSQHLPHIGKAIEIERTFSSLRARYNAVLSVLDQIRIGIFLVLQSGEVLLANREAERILALDDGLRRPHRNRLACDAPDQTAELQAHVVRIAQTARGADDVTQRHMVLPRRSGLGPLLVEIAPIRDVNDELNESYAGAMLLVVDPDQTEALEIGRFAALHNLTQAEGAVCELLLRGLTAPEIADSRGRSVSTIRTQIKTIYSKTRTHHRGELVRLIVKTLPPIL